MISSGSLDAEDAENFIKAYGNYLCLFDHTGNHLTSIIESIRCDILNKEGRDSVEHCKMRVKTAESTIKKLMQRNLDVTPMSALAFMHDLIGVRVVLTFIDDVYAFADKIRRNENICVKEEKDYIKDPKPNGYRSYHIIVSIDGMLAEIQLRTVAMDCWASLEHRMMYKHDVKNKHMIAEELKRCADEISSTDINLQTIRDIIDNSI